MTPCGGIPEPPIPINMSGCPPHNPQLQPGTCPPPPFVSPLEGEEALFNDAVWNEAQFNGSVVPRVPPVTPSFEAPASPLMEMVAELVGTVPRMSALHARQIINRVWRRIRDSRQWSFQFVGQAQLYVPDAVCAGCVNVSFGCPFVTVNPVAAAALNCVAMSIPPLASPILGVGRQIRIGSVNGLSTPTGPRDGMKSIP